MTEENNLFSVFGSWGFVGNEICKDEDFQHNEPNNWEYKSKFQAEYPDIVYTISTVDNYNVLDNDPYTDIQTNLVHLMTVLQSNRMRYGNDFTFTFISSWFVYGNVELPAKEDARCNPKGFYSITKRAAEQLIVSYCDTWGIKYRILRLSNILGKDDKKLSKRRNAMQYMIKTLCEGGEIDLYDEDCRRDYLSIEDAADAIRFLSRKGEWGEIYNVGSGVPSSIHRLVDKALKLTDIKGKINLVPVPEFHTKVQVRDMWLDVTKLYELGWRPKYQPDDVVEELCVYYSKEIDG